MDTSDTFVLHIDDKLRKKWACDYCQKRVAMVMANPQFVLCVDCASPSGNFVEISPEGSTILFDPNKYEQPNREPNHG